MRRDEPAPVVLVAERGYAGTLEKRISVPSTDARV